MESTPWSAAAAHLATVFEAAGAAIVICDRDGVIHHVNALAHRNLTSRPDAPTSCAGLPIDAFFGPTESEDFRVRVSQVLDSGRPHFREDVTTFAGVERTFLTTTLPDSGDALPGLGGSRPALAIVVARDITLERRLADDRQHVLRLLPDILLELDSGGRILSAHAPDPRDMLGFPAEAVPGLGLAQVLGVDAARALFVALEEAARDGAVHTVTTRWPPPERRASTYRDLELRVTTSHGGRSLVIIRDVSERHRLEAQLHLSERLASLGRIAAGVAHEVSNPLTYVYGNIELALETLDALDARDPSATQNLPELAELRTLLSEAREGGDRIRAIIEDIGLLARSDAGGNASRIDLRDVIRSVVRMLGNALRRTAKVELEVAPVALVMGSVPRMIQVLTNLLVNALHAFPSRPIDVNQVVIRLFQRDAEVILEVNDNGTGIAPDVRARIFEPFFTTKDVGQGMGLGLSMSLGIVAAVGGRFEVDTEVGRGTTMRIILPSAPSP